MLNKLKLKNFKLFKEETEVSLSNINLLTGVNGRGKSTLLQALLIFMQSTEFNRTTDKILFNGSCVNLGLFEDIKNVESRINNPVIIGFEFNSPNLSCQIEYNITNSPDDQLVGNLSNIFINGKKGSEIFKYLLSNQTGLFELHAGRDKSFISYVPTLFDLFLPGSYIEENSFLKDVYRSLSFLKIHYISADRIGPKLYYTSQSQKEFNTTGALGENTVSTLFHSKDQIVDQRFINNINSIFHIKNEDIGTTVDWQTNFWLEKIFLGAKYNITELKGTNLITFAISPDGSFNFHKPTNVGYGFSYVLPIIVSGLIAKEGEMLIVENPEAHLHPYAQSIIAKFLTLVSLKGVQVIIESHSEHILNGLRISIYDEVISNKDLNILYFDRNYESYYQTIETDEQGGIAYWPADFFDQATRDLNHLFDLDEPFYK